MALKTRHSPLTQIEQQAMVQQHIPSRIRVIQAFIDNPSPSYAQLTAAGIFSRAIAGFLGLGLKNGQLKLCKDYFPHGENMSCEVKSNDILGGSLVEPSKLSAQDQGVLREGLAEVNVAFAHLTFWSSQGDQTPGAVAKPAYLSQQKDKICALGSLVIRLYQDRAKSYRVSM